MGRHKVISIDIGTYNTKIVEGKANANNVVIEKAFMFPTPQNAVNDGRIVDLELLRNEISNQLNQHKVSTKKVIYTIESTAVIRRELELPSVKSDDMDSMIRFEVEQYLPIVISDYVIEYKLLDEYLDGEVKKCRVSIAALPKDFSEDYLKLTEELKLTPVALDINSNSISKLFGAKAQINDGNYSPDRTVAIIDFGHSGSNLIIVSKGTPRLSRLLGNGGGDIDFNIANTFSLNLNDAREKKEMVKRLLAAVAGLEDSSLLEQAARQSVDNWLTELQKLFQFYASRSNENRIDEIYLYGGGSKLGGLTEYMRSNVNIPVSSIDKHSSIKSGKGAASAELRYFLNAIGAIIRK